MLGWIGLFNMECETDPLRMLRFIDIHMHAHLITSCKHQWLGDENLRSGSSLFYSYAFILRRLLRWSQCIKQIFIEHLLCVKHCSMCRYISKKKKSYPVLMKFIILQERNIISYKYITIYFVMIEWGKYCGGKELCSVTESDKYSEGSQEEWEKCLAKAVSDQTLKDVQECSRQREWPGQRPTAEGPGMFEDSRRPVWLQWGDWGTVVRDGVRNVITGPRAAGNDSLCLYPGTNGKPLGG